MPNAIESLDAYEKALIASDSTDGVYGGKFESTWMPSPQRARLLSVLTRLSDLNVVNVQMWPNYEAAVTFAGDGKALWLSYNGHAFNIWTNFNGREEDFQPSSNVTLEDGGNLDNRQTVTKFVRDYFRPELIEAK